LFKRRCYTGEYHGIGYKILGGILMNTKSLDIKKLLLDNGIILTGGGSLIKNLDKLIEDEVKIIIKRASNPLESVVVGGGKAFNNKKLLRALEMKEM